MLTLGMVRCDVDSSYFSLMWKPNSQFEPRSFFSLKCEPDLQAGRGYTQRAGGAMPASHSKLSRSDSEGRTSSKKSKKDKKSEKDKKPDSEESKVAKPRKLYPEDMENYRPTHIKCKTCTRWADGLAKGGNYICPLGPIFHVRKNV